MARKGKAYGRVSLLAAWLIGLALLGSARNAAASRAFPAALQKALSKQFPDVNFCVPSCAACHLTTLGGPGNINVFGDNLEHQPPGPGQPPAPNLIVGDKDADQKVDEALTRYFASTPAAGLATAPANFPDGTRPSYDSDGDGISDYEELRKLDSPSVRLPRGENEFCPDILYGCGARVAAAPAPVDRGGLFGTGLVIFGLAALRRRLKRAPPST
jgi:hypothetical protein